MALHCSQCHRIVLRVPVHAANQNWALKYVLSTHIIQVDQALCRQCLGWLLHKSFLSPAVSLSAVSQIRDAFCGNWNSMCPFSLTRIACHHPVGIYMHLFVIAVLPLLTILVSGASGSPGLLVMKRNRMKQVLVGPVNDWLTKIPPLPPYVIDRNRSGE